MHKLKSLISKVSKKNLLFALLLLLVIIASILAFYFYTKSQQPQSPAAVAQKEVEDLVIKVGKLIELPKGENPTVATVSDKTKLLDQPFFQNAQNGDKVLIYSKVQKAILYRPSINKIIEVAPVNLGNTQTPNPLVSQSPVASPSVVQTVKVVIYNGTKTAGLAKREGDSLKSKYPNIEITATANSKDDYSQALIVDLTGKNADFVKTLATELSGKVGSLPSGEVKPTNADILIILGE